MPRTRSLSYGNVFLVGCVGCACTGSVEPAPTHDVPPPKEAGVDASLDESAVVDEAQGHPDMSEGDSDTQSSWAPDRKYPGPCWSRADASTWSNLGHALQELRYGVVGRYSYAHALLVREELAFIGDSIDLTIVTHEYDAEGHRIETGTDYGGDGTINDRRWYSYENGNLVTEASDWDGDGIADEQATYTYDAEGRRIAGQVDSGLDGTIDGAWHYDYELDDQGRVVEERVTRDGEAYPWRTLTREYEPSGQVAAETEQKQEGYCWRTEKHEHSYDPFGNRTRTVSDTDVSQCLPNQTWLASGFSDWTFLFDCFAEGDRGG